MGRRNRKIDGFISSTIIVMIVIALSDKVIYMCTYLSNCKLLYIDCNSENKQLGKDCIIAGGRNQIWNLDELKYDRVQRDL